MKAPAVVFPEPKRVEIREMEVPEPGPDQVGIRTVFSGVSQGTERWALTGRYGHFDRDYSAYYPVLAGLPGGRRRRGGRLGRHGRRRSATTSFTMGTHFVDPDHKYPGPCQASHSGYLVAAALGGVARGARGRSRRRIALPHGGGRPGTASG